MIEKINGKKLRGRSAQRWVNKRDLCMSWQGFGIADGREIWRNVEKETKTK